MGIERQGSQPRRASHRELVFGEPAPLPECDWPILDVLSELDCIDYRAVFALPSRPHSGSGQQP